MAMRRSVRVVASNLAGVAGPSSRCSSVTDFRARPCSVGSHRFLHASVRHSRGDGFDLPPHLQKDDEIEQQQQQQQHSRGSSRKISLRNEYIRAPRVRLIDPETNELIEGMFETRQLLESIDHNRFALVQVAEGTNRKAEPKALEQPIVDYVKRSDGDSAPDKFGRSDIDNSTPDKYAVPVTTMDNVPICKLINKSDEYARVRAAKKAMYTDDGGRINRSDAKLHKEVILTWHATVHDRQHKLQPLRTNMIKRGAGTTCKVIVSTKKGNRNHLSLEEKQQMLQQIEDYLCDWSEASKTLTGSSDGEPAAGERSADRSSAALSHIPRRRGEIEWKKERQASLTIEAVRK